jgi:hypothetical protein
MESINKLVENAVRLVCNKSYAVPKGGKKSEIEKMEQFISYKKPLEDVMTDMVTNKFLEKDVTVGNYIQIIIESFTFALEKYKLFNNIYGNDIHFIYKGGNILRVLAKELMHELPGNTSYVLDEYYSKFFQKSDADFSIYINPKLSNFDEIFNDMTNLSYLILSLLRCLFVSDLDKYFDFFASNKDIQTKILEQKMKELNESDMITKVKDSKYFGGHVQKLMFGDLSVTCPEVDPATVSSYNGSNRNDFIIDFTGAQDGEMSQNSQFKTSDYKVDTTNITDTENGSFDLSEFISGDNKSDDKSYDKSYDNEQHATDSFNMTEFISGEKNKNHHSANSFIIPQMSTQNGGAKISQNMMTLLDIFDVVPLHKMPTSNNFLLNTLIDHQANIFNSNPVMPYFISVNKTLRFTLKDKYMAFNLIRLKANSNAVMEYADKRKSVINLAGEMIDVSVLYKNTTGIHEFFENLNSNIKTYEYIGKANNSFKFKATSKEYLIHDLELILFGTVNYPWDDTKYSKRIKRLLYLYLIDMLSIGKPGSINEVKDYLFNFQNDCLIPLLFKTKENDFKSRVSLIVSRLDKYQQVAQTNGYYIKVFFEKYKDILLKSEAETCELTDFIKIIKESFDAIEQAFSKIINYIEYTKGKIGKDQIYEFEMWGGKSKENDAYYTKYMKYKAKYMKLKSK